MDCWFQTRNIYIRIFSDNAQRWLSQLNPSLHQGIRTAGYSGARSGVKMPVTEGVPSDFNKIYNVTQNVCKERYNQCTKLHDSYRFPGISQLYMNAAMIAKNHALMTNNTGAFLEDKDVEELDEYHAHEMKIFKTFQDKINVHELEKWLAKGNKLMN